MKILVCVKDLTFCNSVSDSLKPWLAFCVFLLPRCLFAEQDIATRGKQKQMGGGKKGGRAHGSKVCMDQ